MLDKAIVTVFSIILIITLCISIIGMVLLTAQKISFDHICRNTLFQIDIDGGLTEQNRQDIVMRLTRSGFEEIVVEGPETVQYGSWIDFSVHAQFRNRKWVGLFYFGMENTEFIYAREIISRKIHNAA